MCGRNNDKLANNKSATWCITTLIFMVALVIYAPIPNETKINLFVIISLIIFHKSGVAIRIDTPQKAIVTYIFAILAVLWLAF